MIGRFTGMSGNVGKLLLDRGVILSQVETTDANNMPSVSWVAGSEIAMLYIQTNSNDQARFTNQVPTSDGECYLPNGTVITNRQRIRITKRRGVPLTVPIELDIDGVPDVYPHYVLVQTLLVQT